MMKSVARFFGYKSDSTPRRGGKSSKTTDPFWISSPVSRHHHWEYIPIFMEVEESTSPFSSQPVYMQVEPSSSLSPRPRRKGSVQSLYADADADKRCGTSSSFKQRERKDSASPSPIRLKLSQEELAIPSPSRSNRKGSDRLLHGSVSTRMPGYVEVGSSRKVLMSTQSSTASASKQVERKYSTVPSVYSLGDISSHSSDTGIKRSNPAHSLSSSSISGPIERKNPIIPSISSLQASASTTILELPPPLPPRPHRQVLPHSSKTETTRNSLARSLSSSSASRQVDRKNSANSSIFPMQTSTSTVVSGLPFPLPSRSYRNDPSQSSNTERKRTSPTRSLSLSLRQGTKSPLRSPQSGQETSRLDLSSKEITSTSLHTTPVRSVSSALRKDSPTYMDSYHTTDDSFSLPLSRTKSVDSSSSDKTSIASLFSVEGSRSSTPPVLGSVTSISESVRTPRLPDISSTTAELIEGSMDSRHWGKGRLDFDWDISQEELSGAEDMIHCLRKIITIKWASSQPITCITPLILCHVVANISTVEQYLTFGGLDQTKIKELIDTPTTQVIWDLLSSDSPREGPFPVVKEFCQYFLLLMNKVEQGWRLPYWVPIKVRCDINPSYRHIWRLFHSPGFYKTETDLAVHIDRIPNPFIRAMTLTVMLEIIIESRSPVEASKVLKAIIVQRGNINFLTYVTEPQLANLIATYVRRVKVIAFPSTSRSWDHTLFDEMMYFTDQIWNLCSPWYNVSISERPTLFGAVIARLEGIEIPFCLWIFMHCLGTTHGDRTVISVNALYDQLIDRYIFLTPVKDHPWLMPSICVVNFIIFADQWSRDGFFFDLLQEVMEAGGEEGKWEYVWELCHRQKMFERLVNCQRGRLTKALKFCATYYN